MELKDLIGLHKLSGVDITNQQVKSEYGSGFEDCQCISFCLDGKVYTAIEDPGDGYRSSMREIKISDIELKNKFPAVKVMGVMKPDDNYAKNETLQLLNIKTGQVILEVGKDNTDDYYPYFVSNFTPENMR